MLERGTCETVALAVAAFWLFNVWLLRDIGTATRYNLT